MAVHGLKHELESSKIKVILEEDSAIGLSLTSVENKEDGITAAFFTQAALWRTMLFRPNVHPPQYLDMFPPFTSGGGWTFTNISFGNALKSVNVSWSDIEDNLGQRDRVEQSFSLSIHPTGSPGDLDTISGRLQVELLYSQPDRVRFQLSLNWGGWSGGAPAKWSVMWSAPLTVKANPANPNYFIAANGGMYTSSPDVDLAGPFKVDSTFEPDLVASPPARQESVYPGILSMGLSGLESGGTIMYIHDDLSMRATRVRDYWTNPTINFEHEILTPRGTFEQQGLGAAIFSGGVRYLRVMKHRGNLVGEEVGFDWRKWFLSSAEARTQKAGGSGLPGGATPLRTKVKDNAKRFVPKLMCSFNATDAATLAELKNGAGATKPINIVTELLQWFPFMGKFPFWVRLPYIWWLMTDTANDEWPDLVNKTQGQFENLGAADPLLQSAMKNWRDIGVIPVANAHPLRPVPNDSVNVGGGFLGIWAQTNDNWGGQTGKSGVRRKLTAQVYQSNYKSHNEVTVFVSAQAVSGERYDAGADMTYIKPAAVFDKTNYDRYTRYSQGSHATHQDHHGVLWNVISNKWFPIEREATRTNWDNNEFAIKGDQRAHWADTNNLVAFFFGQWDGSENRPFIASYNPAASNNAIDWVEGSLCAACDSLYASAIAAEKGVLSKFIKRIKDLIFADATPGSWCFGFSFHSTPKDLFCFENNHETHGVAVGHDPGGIDGVVTYQKFLEDLRTRAEAQLAISYPAEKRVLLYEEMLCDLLAGISDGSDRPSCQNVISTLAGSWSSTPIFETALGDWTSCGYYKGFQNLGHYTTAIGSSQLAALEGLSSETGTMGAVRQAAVVDWLFGRKLITLDHGFGVSGGQMGERKDGFAGYTIFSDAVYGLDNPVSFSALVARLLQASNRFSDINTKWRRVRSLRMVSTTAAPLRINASALGHDIGIRESTTRPNILHAVFQDPDNPLRLVGIFVNDWKEKRTDTFEFDPSLYTDFIPGSAGWVAATKYEMQPQGVDDGEQLFSQSEKKTIPIELDGSGVVCVEFLFDGDLIFCYRYDDDEFVEVPIPVSQAEHRIEKISGAGGRFQYGFRSLLPDVSFKIVSLALRVLGLNRSQKK